VKDLSEVPDFFLALISEKYGNEACATLGERILTCKKVRNAMDISTVTSKGHITIPKSIRQHLNLEAGSKVRFVLEDERDYLNLLGTLVYEYEEEHYPMPDIYGVELLKVLLVERGLRQKDLIPVFKTESVVSSVLTGQRKLTASHIQKLAEFFHLSPAVFFPAVK
jgi:AbrB family looped-hinge helix DNA binding protein